MRSTSDLSKVSAKSSTIFRPKRCADVRPGAPLPEHVLGSSCTLRRTSSKLATPIFSQTIANLSPTPWIRVSSSRVCMSVSRRKAVACGNSLRLAIVLHFFANLAVRPSCMKFIPAVNPGTCSTSCCAFRYCQDLHLSPCALKHSAQVLNSSMTSNRSFSGHQLCSSHTAEVASLRSESDGLRALVLPRLRFMCSEAAGLVVTRSCGSS
mmetsp:Transcript_35629/g.81669  ORF Transcript_35629/g.81669 Transcript_35629/m.81669 type:complete len:209 (+) Transcript_35629:755-1381(+)